MPPKASISNIRFSRVFDGPNKDTFQIPSIRDFVMRYLRLSRVSVDPFARNSQLATITNDLNPKTSAQYHLDVLDFLKLMYETGIRADLIIFDPPYSPTQSKISYEGFGKKMTMEEGQRVTGWSPEKFYCDKILQPNGVFLHFGWNSQGMFYPGYNTEEIMLVCHYAGHNDTICLAQRKVHVVQDLVGGICISTLSAAEQLVPGLD